VVKRPDPGELTEDLDVFVEASATNAARLRNTLVKFAASAPAESELARAAGLLKLVCVTA
jgi:hypothetical protein